MKLGLSGIKNQISKRKELIVIVIFSLALGYLVWKFYTKNQEVPEVEMTQKSLDTPEIPAAQLDTLRVIVDHQKAPIELTRYGFLLRHNLFDPEYAKSYYENSIQVVDYIGVAEVRLMENNVSAAISEIRKITDNDRFIILRPRAIEIIDLLMKEIFENEARKNLLTKEDCQGLLQISADIMRDVGGFKKQRLLEEAVNAYINSLN